MQIWCVTDSKTKSPLGQLDPIHVSPCMAAPYPISFSQSAQIGSRRQTCSSAQSVGSKSGISSPGVGVSVQPFTTLVIIAAMNGNEETPAIPYVSRSILAYSINFQYRRKFILSLNRVSLNRGLTVLYSGARREGGSNKAILQEPTEISKQPIITRFLRDWLSAN
eukprot:sb/3472551/